MPDPNLRIEKRILPPVVKWISTIGRMRTPKAIPILIQFLKDIDPKVVLQAIRGLINFKMLRMRFNLELAALESHPNELIAKMS